MKIPVVPGTDDALTIEVPFTERAALMRTAVSERKKTPFSFEKGDFTSMDPNQFRTIVGNIIHASGENALH